MEWYLGAGVDDFMVPKDQELFDRLPSPESWSGWGISTLEESEYSYRRFEIDPKWEDLELSPNDRISYNEVEMECLASMEDQPSVSSINEQLSDESLLRSFMACDQEGNQLDGLAGIRQMDEYFLSSLPEDLPGSYLKSFFHPPGSQSGMAPAEHLMEDTVLDSQSTSSDTQTIGSSKHRKTYASTPQLGWEERGVNPASQFISCNTDQSHWPVIQDLQDKICRQHSDTDGVLEEETSVEETVLQDLEIVLTQLTDKTRICFRDALYRLAKHSGQHEEHSKPAETFMVAPQWTVDDGKSRMEGNGAEELETNVVDRAIANIMFNKMDLNMREFPISASPSLKQEIETANKPPNYSSSLPQFHGILGYPTLCGDVEVPILSQELPKAIEEPD